ncbi:MAG: tRNA pseudouridine(38-40) synthase TruA [Saccharofermentanales bacterium]|jgi:tRNA pseudouridine38-40 synthase
MIAGRKRKIALAVEYDGSCFHGWQRQQNALSVQEILESAWLGLTGEEIVITGCSRTDAGVSARRHISHFCTATSIPDEKIFLALNSKLRPGLSVLASRGVPANFNARYGALGKTYSYRLLCSPARPAIERRTCAWLPLEPDYSLMTSSLNYFIGEHDFSSLMDQGSPSKRHRRTIFDLVLAREEIDRLMGTEYLLTVTGDGFLYHMVRILMGTIVAVGQKKIALCDIAALIEQKDRTKMGITMPAAGLVLEKVFYCHNLFDNDSWPYARGDENGKY